MVPHPSMDEKTVLPYLVKEDCSVTNYSPTIAMIAMS